MTQNLRLGLFFTWDVSLSLWQEKGLLQREIKLYEALVKKGVDVTFFTWGSERDAEIATALPSIKVVPLHKKIPYPNNKILRAMLSVFVPFVAYKEIRQCDILKTNQMWGGWSAVLSKVICRKPLIARCGFELMDFTIRQGHGKLRQAFTWLISWITYAAANQIVVATYEDKEFVHKTFWMKSDKINIHPNWIDTKIFAPKDVKQKENTILYVGRLNAQKNLDALLEAVAQTPYTLDLVGDGELRADLENRAEELGTKANFLGFVANDTLPQLYNEYPVYILPSHYEGNPKTLLEAMSCGRPVIGADVSGIASVVSHEETGLLCAEDAGSIKNALDQLMSDTGLQKELGANARKQIQNNQTLGKIVTKEKVLYETTVIEKKKSSYALRHRISHISNKFARKFQKLSDQWAQKYWHDYPFGPVPKADHKTYENLWKKELKISYPEIDQFEKEKKFAVDQDWFQNLGLHTQIVIKDSPLCYQHGRILYSALREHLSEAKQGWEKNKTPLNHRTITIAETGTARGFSAVVMAKALSDEEVSGQIITYDLLPHYTKMYWNCIDDLEGPKTRQELLSPWKELVDSHITFVEGDSRVAMEKTGIGRFNFAFLDGAHTYKDVMSEFGLVVPHQRAGDIIVFDDYSDNVFPGLVRAVDEGCEKWGYDKQVLRANDNRAYVIARKKA